MVITSFYLLYFVVMAIGIFKKKKEKVLVDKKNNFAVIIAARNEEAVIANLIKSLKKQNYPKEHYEIYAKTTSKSFPNRIMCMFQVCWKLDIWKEC